MCKSSEFVYDPGLDNIKYLFRIYVTAFRAGTRSFVSSINNILEVIHRLQRVSIIDLESTNIKDDKRIEHLKDIRRRLVNNHEDHLPSQRQFFKKVHDIF